MSSWITLSHVTTMLPHSSINMSTFQYLTSPSRHLQVFVVFTYASTYLITVSSGLHCVVPEHIRAASPRWDLRNCGVSRCKELHRAQAHIGCIIPSTYFLPSPGNPVLSGQDADILLPFLLIPSSSPHRCEDYISGYYMTSDE